MCFAKGHNTMAPSDSESDALPLATSSAFETRPRGYKTFFQSQLKLRLKSLSLISTESEFEFEVIKLSELNLN